MPYIFLDLNVRDPFVSSSTETMLEDTKVVVQSVWRLLTTEEGEIPNYRNYGLNIKQFSQYPLNKRTANLIYNYVKKRLSAFEQRATIIKGILGASYEDGVITMDFYLRVNSTGETVQLPTWSVKVNALTI